MEIKSLTPSIQRVYKVTHMHEMAAKSVACNDMLDTFYDRMLFQANKEGVKLSRLLTEEEMADDVLNLDIPGKD